MKSLFYMVVIASILGLAGCSDEEPASKANVIRDVPYYLANDEARMEMYEYCENNPGFYKTKPNCMSAYEANRKKKIQRILDESKAN